MPETFRPGIRRRFKGKGDVVHGHAQGNDHTMSRLVRMPDFGYASGRATRPGGVA